MALFFPLILSAGEIIMQDCGSPYGCYPPSQPPIPPLPSPQPPIPPLPAPSPGPGPGAAIAPAPAPAPVGTVASSPIPRSFLPSGHSSKPVNGVTVLIIAISVLAACALILTCYVVLRRYRALRRRRALAAAAAQTPQPAPPGADDDVHQDLLIGAGLEEPYHVWYIRTAGLDEQTIGAIPAYGYKRGEGLVDSTDCAVCLGEFREGEILRLLPKCSHAFHVPCIDTWLRSHVNCPLCRAPILAPPLGLPHAADDAQSNPGSSSSSSSAPDTIAVALPAGQPAMATTTGGNSPGPGSSHRHTFLEGGAEDGNTVPSPAQDVVFHHSDSSLSDEDSDVWVPIDLGNEASEEEGDTDTDPSAAVADESRHAELQQVRRSVSMDSSSLGGLLLRMGLSGEDRRKLTSEGNPSATKNGEGRGSNCKGSPSPGASPGMERSMSSSGGRPFLLMFSGRPRSSILPL